MCLPGLFVGILTVVRCAVAAGKLPLGVAPGDQAKYAGASFQCLDGSGASLPPSAVNDEFCDCADGSDEPGTGACAGQEATLFFCANAGSTARRLYASRVSDGVCDCCDGSDEASLAARRPAMACANVCAEQGAVEKEEIERRMNSLKLGVAKREEIARQAVADRADWQKELKVLQDGLPALEATFEAAKAAAAEEKKAKDVLLKACPSACMWRQTGGCDPAGQREEANDKACNATIPKGSSGFCDCDGNGVKADHEKGFNCEGGERLCCKVCLDVSESSEELHPAEGAAAEKAVSPDGKEDKVVSEYTKWMDGAEKAMEGKEEEKEEKVVSEYTKWMDGAETAVGSKDDKKPAEECNFAAEKDGWYEGTVVVERSVGDVAACRTACCANDQCKIWVFRDRDSACIQKASDKPIFHEEAGHQTAVKIALPLAAKAATMVADGTKSSAVDEEREARTAVNKNKEEARKLEQKIDALSDDHLGYASLAGKTLSKHIGEFDYKVEFFGTAKQGSTSLGKWDKWTGKASGVFSNGQTCWSGPARKLEVKFQCGIEEALEDVSEPSRCVYEALITHPGACDPEELKSLGSASRVVGPKDEL